MATNKTLNNPFKSLNPIHSHGSKAVDKELDAIKGVINLKSNLMNSYSSKKFPHLEYHPESDKIHEKLWDFQVNTLKRATFTGVIATEMLSH